MKIKVWPVFTSITVSILFWNCNKTNDNPVKPEFSLKTADTIDNEEYKVYSAFLSDWSSEQIVIQQETTAALSVSLGNTYYETVKAEISNIDCTVFTDYIVKNDSVFFLGNLFNIAAKTVSLISEDELNFIFRSQDVNGGWEKFHTLYPNSNGYIQFSRVGFNAGKNQAIFEMGHFYASLGAGGLIVFLRKENNTWRVVQSFYTWIS